MSLVERIKTVTPQNIFELSDEELRKCYFNRQKQLIQKMLTPEIISGKLNLEDLNSLSSEEIRSTLIKITRIGHWTMVMYLLMSLHFDHIFPFGDLATVKSVYELELVPATASKEDIINFMKKFSPFQSVVNYILFPCSLALVLLGL